MCKKVLLIGGGGTLGSYASEELLKKNCITDVICLENKVSGNKNLHYFNMNADLNGLTEFLKNRYYDGIINFIHYTDPESYKSVHRLLCEKTSHFGISFVIPRLRRFAASGDRGFSAALRCVRR